MSIKSKQIDEKKNRTKASKKDSFYKFKRKVCRIFCVILIYLTVAVSILSFAQESNLPVQSYSITLKRSLELHESNGLSISRNPFIKVVRNVM